MIREGNYIVFWKKMAFRGSEVVCVLGFWGGSRGRNEERGNYLLF